jgi:hypothetical protein
MNPIELYIYKSRNNVKGWLTWTDAEILRSILMHEFSHSKVRHVVEIGVHRGKSSILFLLSPYVTKLISVDLFSNQGENIDNSGSAIMEEFLLNLELYSIDLNRVVVMKKNSTSVKIQDINEIVDSVDLFHIDGGHTKDVVLNDLELARGTISDWGVIVVDDFLRPDWPEVGQACYEWLDNNLDFGIFCIGHNKVFISHKAYNQWWRNLIMENSQLRFFIRKYFDRGGFQIPVFYHFITPEWGIKKQIYEYTRLFYPSVFMKVVQMKRKFTVQISAKFHNRRWRSHF